MLDGAFTSPKIRRLAAILEIPWPHALGLAGLLWRFAAKHAPTGEVGRHDDEEIATALEWPGDAVDLVAALARCRLLDAVDGPARLLVHDWPEHAPRYVSATLKRRGEDFSANYRHETTDPTTDPTTDGTTDPTTSSSSSSYASTSSGITLVHPDEEIASEPGRRRPASRQTPEDPVSGVLAIRTIDESDSTSNAGEAILEPLARSRSRPPDPVREDLIEAIWSLWVPGRKTGKKTGVASIRRSIRRLVASGMSTKDAAATIAQGTKADADRYRSEVERGLVEIKFVPMGSTYFNQERWNDDDAPPDLDAIRRDAIGDEIARTRSAMG